MSLPDGMTPPFFGLQGRRSFVLRDFSEKLHGIVQNEIGLDEDVFPRREPLGLCIERTT